jgi:DNA-binding transcriptional LysR family regulator
MDVFGDLTMFVAVAEARSFSGAARATGMPISSMSRRIALLEERLGTRLLQRNSRKVELSEQGRVYLERAQAILAALEAAAEEVRESSAPPRGRLRVTMPAGFGELFLTPLFVEYASRFPEVSFELDLSARMVDMVAERFDVAIRIGVQADSTLTARKIATVKTALVASPAYLDRAGTPQTPADLLAHSCLRLTGDRSPRAAWELQNRGKRASLAIAPRADANHPGILRQMARLGMGIALLDELIVIDDLESGALRRVLPGWGSAPVPVWAVTTSKVLPARTRLLLQCLRDHINLVQARVVRDALAPPSEPRARTRSTRGAARRP